MLFQNSRKIKNYWHIVQNRTILMNFCIFCCASFMNIYIHIHLYIYTCIYQFSSVAQLCPTRQPHGLQHARLPCPSPTSGAYSNSCSSSWWCHPTIPSSVVPFSSHLQSFPASESFQMSQFFTSGDQSIGVSASAWVLPMNIQDWFLLRLVETPCSPRDSQESSPAPYFKRINSLVLSFLYNPTLTSIYEYWKNHSFD